MRRALNENPMVQLVVIGIIGLIGVVMLFTTVLKKDEAPATDASSAASESATATAATATATATSDPAASVPTTPGSTGTAAPPAPPPSAAADGLLPTQGLPKDLLIAYAKDKAIALLVVDPRGVADRRVEAYTKKLSSNEGVEVFVVDVKDIAEYSRITSGVAVSRAPALVAIRPRKLTNNSPTATVSYGFRSARSVEQALNDALYEGGQVSAYP